MVEKANPNITLGELEEAMVILRTKLGGEDSKFISANQNITVDGNSALERTFKSSNSYTKVLVFGKSSNYYIIGFKTSKNDQTFETIIKQFKVT